MKCYQCFRPQSLCFCDSIPRIDNRTDVLILQHIGERFHPFNTARIVHKALDRCELIVDHNRPLGQRELPIQPNAGLLYLDADAPTLAELPPNQRPKQLVIIDGTWYQAKTIVRDAPQLQSLPCFRLSPTTPGQYRIRREPNAQSLSTLEATVAALRELEPETAGLEQLLAAFTTMVEDQLQHPAGHVRWRRNRKRQSRPRHLPAALLQDSDSIVVAYGEATPGITSGRAQAALPVNWVAQRLNSGERFHCRIQQPQPLPAVALEHMGLTVGDFDDSLTHDQFRAGWQQFLKRGDTVVVYHERTFQLLQNIGAFQPRCLVLKSIFKQLRNDFQSLEELIATAGLATPAPEGKCRATQRLEMSLAMVEHLRQGSSYARQRSYARQSVVNSDLDS